MNGVVMVRVERIELTLSEREPDFESGASTSSATPAYNYIKLAAHLVLIFVV